MRSGRRVLAVNAFWSLLSHLMWRGALMLTTVILARSLATSDFAAYSYFQMTSTMFATYASLGLGVTASRFFAEAGHERPGEAAVPLGTLLTLSLAMAACAVAVILMIPAEALRAGLDVHVSLIAIGAATISLGVVPAGAILGAEKFHQAARVSALSGCILVVGSLWAAYTKQPMTAMLALVVGSLAQAGGQMLIAGRAVGWNRIIVGMIPHRSQVRRVLTFAGPMMIVSVMTGSGAWIVGRLILDGPSGESAFSLYSIGMQWFSLTLLLPGMVSRVLLPRLVRERATATKQSSGLVRQSTWMVTAVASAVVIVGVMASPLITQVYGGGHDIGPWFIAAYMLAGLVNAPLTTMGNAVVADDGQVVWMWVTLVWFILLLMVGWFAVEYPLEGLSGALAQGVSSAVQLAVVVVYARYRGLV